MYRGFRLHSSDGIDNKAIDLFLWYRDDLPALQDSYERDLSDCYRGADDTTFPMRRTREPFYQHNYPDTVKDEKLAELMAIRRGLWT